MLAALRKKSLIRSLIRTLVIFAAGFFLVIFFLSETITVLMGYTPFENLSMEDLLQARGEHIEIDLDAAFGCYAETVEVERGYPHMQRTTDLYYVIQVGGANALDYRYISACIPAVYQEQMDALVERTYADDYSQPLHFSGRLSRLNQESYAYFKDFFLSADWTEEEFQEMTLPCAVYIYSPSESLNYKSFCLFNFGVGVFLLIWGVCGMIRCACDSTMRKFRKAYEAAGYTEADVESDLTRPLYRADTGDVKIGRLCLYYNLNSHAPALLPNDRMIWAYCLPPAHWKNGREVGKKRKVFLYALEGGRPLVIKTPDMAFAQKIVNKISKTMPWVVIGYTEDREKLLSSDRAQFLQLRYNTTPHVIVDSEPDDRAGSIAKIAGYTNL